MPELFLEQFDDAMPAAVWRQVNIEPWNGDLWLKLRPYTQMVRDQAARQAKQNKCFNLHKIKVDGKTVTVNGDENKAINEEFLDLVVEDWRGVAGDPPCDRENKLKLRGSTILFLWIFNTSNTMAGIEVTDDEGNS